MLYIGLDIGDGESCATYYRKGSGIEPQTISIEGRNSFISAVATVDGQVRIGSSAIIGDSNDLRVRFKSKYMTDRNASAQALKMFAGEIAKCLEFEVGRIDGSRLKDCVVTVGCPAGWKKDDREYYRKLLADAGIPNVQVVSESRAAFLYGRNASALKVNPTLLRDSALVIDIGSSTLDFAYVVGGKETGVGAFGDVMLGGGLVDEYILKAAVETSPDRAEIEGIFKESDSWRSQCLIAAREVKEKFFNNEKKYANQPCEKKMVIRYAGRVDLVLSMSSPLMWKIVNQPMKELHGRTFRACLQDELNHAQQVTMEHPPKLVMLTGGASRMEFFQEQCEETFDDSTVVVCDEPEYWISRGLAYAGVTDKNIGAFRNEIRNYTAGNSVEVIVAKHLPELIPELSEVISQISIDEGAIPAIWDWRGGKLRTLNDMNDSIQKRISLCLDTKGAKDKMSAKIQQWLCIVSEEIQKQIDSICIEYEIPIGKMNLGNAGIGGKTIGQPSPFKPTLEFLDIINIIVGAILVVVLGMICGGAGTALIAAGPIGIIVGALIAAGTWFFGKDAAKEWVMGLDIPVFLRQIINVGDIMNDVNRRQMTDKIAQSLADSKEFKASIINSVSGELDGYLMKMAGETEVQVN